MTKNTQKTAKNSNKNTLTGAKIKKWSWISLIAIVVFAIISITLALTYFFEVTNAQSYDAGRPYLIAFVVVNAFCIFAIILLFLIFQTICSDYFGWGEKSKKHKKSR